jgi:hypothetical protein
MNPLPFPVRALSFEARALLTRLERVRPFALLTPTVAAAGLDRRAGQAIERHLAAGRRDVRARVDRFLAWLHGPEGLAAAPAEAQRRFAFLRLRFNAALTQLDIFADALVQRSEHETGVFLGGLDVAAEDALRLSRPFYEVPPLVTYLDRGHGAAIRRARTRLPGGGENPVAVVRVPRERMVGSGIAASLVHEVGHQGAALLDLVATLREALKARQAQAPAGLERQAWELWERWISEIVADFWSVATLGVAATQGLMGVVSLPRAFVFRIQTDDPHPFPWIRARLSAAMGGVLYPDPQWRRLGDLWAAFYPTAGLEPGRQHLVAALSKTSPEFVRLLTEHRPKSLRGARLAEVFPLEARQPARLRELATRFGKKKAALTQAAPTLAFAVLGQAKQDGRLSPEKESSLTAELLTHWALRRATSDPGKTAAAPKALAA